MDNCGKKNDFIKADGNIIIKKKMIRWIKKIDECLYICSNQSGCSEDVKDTTTLKLCKANNPTDYEVLNKKF